MWGLWCGEVLVVVVCVVVVVCCLCSIDDGGCVCGGNDVLYV